jgi:hypothetical protein
MRKSFIDMTHAGETPRVHLPGRSAASAAVEATVD